MRCVGKELGEGREGRRRKENGKKWRGTEGETDTDIDRLHRIDPEGKTSSDHHCGGVSMAFWQKKRDYTGARL